MPDRAHLWRSWSSRRLIDGDGCVRHAPTSGYEHLFTKTLRPVISVQQRDRDTKQSPTWWWVAGSLWTSINQAKSKSKARAHVRSCSDGSDVGSRKPPYLEPRMTNGPQRHALWATPRPGIPERASA
ncbi:hypothetical protein ZHAS_00009606 [Anopheles sinensis]|uniref:Uncharacterized protein n=1 Tax=Anopheles sinensis TaxID=74873 RepID=A0A084VVN2_ANOSI|nr:hypothetical protein ZHAS_00009606 [Anopheles sinensis]